MSGIVYPEVESYLRGLIPETSGLLGEIEKKALAEQVPIVTPEVARLLHFLVASRGAKRILEVGTAVGYSTLWLAFAGGEESKVTTIDWNLFRAEEAEANFRQAGVTKRIQLLKGDAREIIPGLQGPFDFIFLDAMKNHYPEILPMVVKLLSPGGLLVADNVLFRGMVALEEVPDKYKRGVGNLRQFLDELTNHPQLETVILPLGDGVSLSQKRGEPLEQTHD